MTTIKKIVDSIEQRIRDANRRSIGQQVDGVHRLWLAGHDPENWGQLHHAPDPYR